MYIRNRREVQLIQFTEQKELVPGAASIASLYSNVLSQLQRVQEAFGDDWKLIHSA